MWLKDRMRQIVFQMSLLIFILNEDGQLSTKEMRFLVLRFCRICYYFYRRQSNVILFTGRGGWVSVPACTTGHMTRGSLSGGSLSKGGLCQGGPPYGSTHPTVMHSCNINKFSNITAPMIKYSTWESDYWPNYLIRSSIIKF